MKVVVIGAGVAGLGIAWRLARGGAEVIVLERAQVGNGATTVSGGMLGEATELGTMAAAAGSLGWQANVLWPDFASQLQIESKINISYRRNGALLVRMLGEDAVHHYLPDARGDGLDGAAARQMEPLLGDEIADAMFVVGEAQVDSQALCRALAVSVVRAGGQVLSNEAAVRFEMSGHRAVGVATPFTVHYADAFVLANGSWASRMEGLPPGTVPLITPVKGEVIVLTPPQGAAVPGHVVWGNGIYVVPRRGRVLVGATTELAGFDTSRTTAALGWLRRQSTRLMPALKDWQVAEHWAGLRPISPDGLPVLGETAVEGLFVASGQYRNGILFAPAVAEHLSCLLLEQKPIDPAFAPRRFDNTTPSPSVMETPHRAAAAEAGAWPTGF